MKDKEFIDWCFDNLDGTEDKYDIAYLVWKYLSLENHKLAKKLARLDKTLKDFALAAPHNTSLNKQKQASTKSKRKPRHNYG